jgi:ankyrin repeat protein
LINSSVNGNQQRFEKLIFKQAADFANLSKTDVPLIANTINWHLQFSAQLTPGLDIAVDKRLIKRLLELGARVNTSDEKGQRNAALWMALQQSDTEVVKLLLEYGCDPNSSCALTTAAKKGALNHMQALLQYGANPNQPQNGKFALNEACLRGDLSMAKLLLQSGAKIHEKNAEMTALMSAIISGNIELCSLLIQSGAKAHIPTDEQLAYFSLQLAEEHTGVNIYELMIDLTKAMSITDGGEPDNNSTNILTLAKLCLAIPQDQNVPLNFSYEKLLGQFCNHYILSKTYFSIAPAGASELEQMHAYIQNGITNNSIIIEMAKLFAAEIYKRDGVKFTFDY